MSPTGPAQWLMVILVLELVRSYQCLKGAGFGFEFYCANAPFDTICLKTVLTLFEVLWEAKKICNCAFKDCRL